MSSLWQTMGPINFQSAGSNYRDPFNNVSWNNNPIYQSPESTSVSWADQVEHWNAPEEGIETLTPRMAEVYSGFGTDNASVADSIRQLWQNNERIGNRSSQIPEAATTSEFNTTNVSSVPEELSSEIAASEETVEDISTAVEATEAGAEVAEGSTGIGLIAILNQQLGQATTSALQANVNDRINQDYNLNSIQQGIGATEQANIIKGQEEVNSSKIAAASSIGSIFGPLGSLAGQAIGQALYQPGDSYNLNTANSFNGMINPQDTGVVQSLNTDAASGDTQQIENV